MKSLIDFININEAANNSITPQNDSEAIAFWVEDKKVVWKLLTRQEIGDPDWQGFIKDTRDLYKYGDLKPNEAMVLKDNICIIKLKNMTSK